MNNHSFWNDRECNEIANRLRDIAHEIENDYYTENRGKETPDSSYLKELALSIDNT